ncbi:MAG: enoyl-ACP reductase FabI [Pirellulales bacterium]
MSLGDLSGRRALVVGIANEHSIAYGIARALRGQGAEIAATYLNDKAKPHVEPLARQLDSPLLLPLDVRKEGQMEQMFESIRAHWDRLDILVHSIAFAPKDDLQGALVDCSAAGFAEAMDVSVHSLLRMTKLALPLLTEGGSILTLSYQGATRVMDGYQLMGPVKAALESVVRYLAHELGPRGVRVNAISPGPIATRAASGLKDFQRQIDRARAASPLGQTVTIDDVGAAAAYLCSPGGRHMTGTTLVVDGGVYSQGF